MCIVLRVCRVNVLSKAISGHSENEGQAAESAHKLDESGCGKKPLVVVEKALVALAAVVVVVVVVVLAVVVVVVA
ncbi:unnamed protein product, partial [Symbiodinium microadriaticum]